MCIVQSIHVLFIVCSKYYLKRKKFLIIFVLQNNYILCNIFKLKFVILSLGSYYDIHLSMESTDPTLHMSCVFAFLFLAPE